jgi:hypothetical protein
MAQFELLVYYLPFLIFQTAILTFFIPFSLPLRFPRLLKLFLTQYLSAVFVLPTQILVGVC